MPLPAVAKQAIVMGATDERLVINQVTCDVSGVLGFRPEELIGVRFENLLVPADRPRLALLVQAAALQPCARTEAALAHLLRLRRRDGGVERCRLHLAPSVPGKGFAFSLVLVAPDEPATDDTSAPRPEGRSSPAQRLVADVAHAEGGVAARLRGAGVTPRETEVVLALLRGDRVPRIARKLYLSPGTVRNHLSSAFRKLGVANQQELVDVLRAGVD